MKHLTTLLAILAISGAAVASAPPSYTASGSFTLGDPVGWLVLDACGMPEFEGQNSNCVALPASVAGHAYTLDITDATIVGPVEWSVCYYDATGAFLDCEADVVEGTFPADAAFYSVNGVGALVSWTITA